MANLLHRLGTFAVRRRRLVLLGWLVAFIAIAGTSAAVSKPFTTAFSIPGTESQQAIDLIKEKTPGATTGGATGRVVFAAPAGKTLTSGTAKTAVEQSAASIAKVAGVASAVSPYQAGTVSENGRVAYVDVQFTAAQGAVATSTTDGLAAATKTATAAGLDAEFGGAAAPVATEQPIGEVLGVAVALLVLAITFGSMLSAGLPLLSALIGVGLGLTGIGIVNAVSTLSSTSTSLAAMLGLAVGIDYTLFILSRHRTQVFDGMDIDASIAKAVATAGSAVVFAGATVIIALAALMVTGIPFLAQMGLTAAMTVAIAVLLSLTFVPALLAVAGRRATKGKNFSTKLPDPDSGTKPTMGARWIAVVMRRPIVASTVVIVALLGVASPALDMRLGLPDDGSSGTATTQRKAYDLVTGAFGTGYNGPLTVVASIPSGSDAQAIGAATAAEIKDLPDVAAVSPAILNPAKDLAIISVTPASGPSSQATQDLVNGIRDTSGAIKAETGATVLVTGQTATNIDVSERMSSALAPYLAVVVGLALLLLMLAFRSILVPITAIAGFLLTILASFGAVVAVFQKGFLAELIGVSTQAPLVSLLPVLIVGVIFGLAMDYQVFLVSRMREDFIHGSAPRDAVRDGFRHGARVVTAAALIMISVFAGFILPDDPIIKSIGFAFAVGILIDAFLIRMTLIPALMTLLGAKAWWLPTWLDKAMPNVDIEGATLTSGQAAPHDTAVPVDDRVPVA